MHGMESWSFPTVYDETYLPRGDSRYWFTVRETMPPAQREQALGQSCGQTEGRKPGFVANGAFIARASSKSSAARRH